MIFTRLLSHRFGVRVNDVLVNLHLMSRHAGAIWDRPRRDLAITPDHGTSGRLQRIILHQAGIHFKTLGCKRR